MRRAGRGHRLARIGALQPDLRRSAARSLRSQVYRDGEIREYHALADGGDAGFAASAAAMVAHLRGEAPVPDLDAATTEHVMRALIVALDSAQLGMPSMSHRLSR